MLNSFEMIDQVIKAVVQSVEEVLFESIHIPYQNVDPDDNKFVDCAITANALRVKSFSSNSVEYCRNSFIPNVSPVPNIPNIPNIPNLENPENLMKIPVPTTYNFVNTHSPP